MDFSPIIGLEIHVELSTKSKMFCSCSADYLRVVTSKQGSPDVTSGGSYFVSEPNTHVCPVCLGLPGALPVANKKAIEWTVLTGMALGCQTPLFSKFDRKKYFYPDLPKGYQISQYDLPFCVKGKLNGIRITRVHLEEDTAKMIHTKVKGENASLIDFNRSGVPLMEIVTEPDIRSAPQAKEFLKKLQQVIRYLEVSDCDMEKGSMRLEVNISVKKVAKVEQVEKVKLPEYKVEIKNLNSFRFVEKALDYEIKRQIQLIKVGKKPIQETRGWDEVKQKTTVQRYKEEAADYRYFPEPDLPPIRWKKEQLKKLKKQLPELPDEKQARFIKQFNLSKYQAAILVASKDGANYYEEAVKVGKKHKISAQELANVIINKRVDTDKILPAELIEILVKKRKAPAISSQKLKKLIDKVLKTNKKAVADYKSGKKEVLGFLIGQVIRAAKTKIDPKQTRQILQKALNAS